MREGGSETVRKEEREEVRRGGGVVRERGSKVAPNILV